MWRVGAAIVVMAIAASASERREYPVVEAWRLELELATALREIPPTSLAFPAGCQVDDPSPRAVEILIRLRDNLAAVRASRGATREAALSTDLRVRQAAQHTLRLAGAPVPVASYLADLDVDDRMCRAVAFQYLAALGPEAADAFVRVAQLLAWGRWDDRRDAAYVLARIGTDAALDQLIAALSQPNHLLQKAVIEGIGAQGPRAERALPYLEPFRDHWSNELRRAAADAMSKISDRPSSATLRPCPIQEDGADPQLDGERLEWHLIDARSAPPSTCPKAEPDQTDWLIRASECLALTDGGEWGGSLQRAVDGRWRTEYVDEDQDAFRFVSLGDRVLVLESMRHMVGSGRISELRRVADRWVLEPLVELPSAIRSYALSSKGTLGFEFHEYVGVDRASCESETKGFISLYFSLSPDGTLRPLP